MIKAFPPAPITRSATARPSPGAPPGIPAHEILNFTLSLQVRKWMTSGAPSFAEKGFHRSVGYLFQAHRLPARRVVLVDQQGAYALDEVALFETLLDHAEFHAEAVPKLHRLAPLQLAQGNGQHRGRTAAHELRGLPRPIRILRPGFAVH